MPNSQAVKASDFDSDMRWSESNLGSQGIAWPLKVV